jgi:hypothetical protein
MTTKEAVTPRVPAPAAPPTPTAPAQAANRGVPASAATPPVASDQEEITLVRPPRQIRINLDRPLPQGGFTGGWTTTRRADDGGFFPTLLGDTGKPQRLEVESHEAMFATYYSAPVRKTTIPYRTVMFGGGVLVLIVTFLIGDGFVGDHVQSKNESTVAKSKTRDTAPRAKKVVPPINMMSADKPREEAIVDEDDLKPIPTSDRLTRTIEEPEKVTKTAAVKKDTPKATSRNDAPSPRPVPRPTPAVLRKADPPARSNIITPPPVHKNPNIATRPRIVKVPK